MVILLDIRRLALALANHFAACLWMKNFHIPIKRGAVDFMLQLTGQNFDTGPNSMTKEEEELRMLLSCDLRSEDTADL